MISTKKQPNFAKEPEAEAVAEEKDGSASNVNKGDVERQRPDDPLEEAEAKAQENYDRFLRATAEFENYKKRAEREMNDFRKFANESLVKEILPLVDNLERALAIECNNEKKAFEGLREGVEMTFKGLMDSLEKFGVVPVEAQGRPFDPNYHQAVSQEETDEYADNTVSQELQKGYMLRDRLIRPSMVVVSKKPDKKADEDSGARENDGNESKIKIKVH